MRKIFAVLVLSLAGAALSGPDDYYAAGADITRTVNSNAAAWNGGEYYGNPALLGLDRTPTAGIAVLPFSVGLRSGELRNLPSAVSNKYLYKMLFDSKDSTAAANFVTYLLNESFGLWGISDDSMGEKRSDKLTEKLKGGIGLNLGAQVPIVFYMDNISASIRPRVDLDLKIPGGLLLPAVSYQKGLQSDAAPLDLSTLRVDAIAATELAFKIGRPIDALPDFFDYLNLDRGAWGVGIKQILGHGYLALSAEKGSQLEYDTVSNAVKLDAKLKIVSAGTGINIGKQVGAGVDFFDDDQLKRFNDEGWIDEDALLLSKPVSGWGWGVGAGAVFHNDAHFVSVDVQDIGLIIWNGRAMRRDAVEVKGTTKKLTIDSKNSGSSTGGSGAGGTAGGKDVDKIGLDDYLSFEMLPGDDAGSRKNLVMSLPTALNLDYTYFYDLSDRPELNNMVTYLTATAGVSQQLVTGIGRNTFVPELSLGGSAGLLWSVLPLRYGFVFGGPDKLGSVFSTGVNTQYVSFDISYKTIGHPFMVAKEGFEVAAVLALNWGYDRKKPADEEITVRRPTAARPDTGDDPHAKLLESAWALWKSAKANVDTVNADLDSSDARKKAAEEESLLTPHDGEIHQPAGHHVPTHQLPAHQVPIHNDATKKSGVE